MGADLSLVSDRKGNFDDAYRTDFGRRLTLDGYTTLNMRAGADFGRFNLSVYARNLANTRGIVATGTFGTRPNGGIEVSPIQPRIEPAYPTFSLVRRAKLQMENGRRPVENGSARHLPGSVVEARA
jgi:outer membrane receptor protein involved in Fe transport